MFSCKCTCPNLVGEFDTNNFLVFTNVVADLSSIGSGNKIVTKATIQAVTGAGQTANAQKAYVQILKLAVDMSIPSDDYNNAGVETFTPLGRGVLVLNSLYKSSFDVNVLASLFNSAKIGEQQYFSKVIVAPLSGTKQLGVVLDEEAYLWGYRFNVSQNIINPANLTIEEYYHAWVKRGVVPFRQAVALVHA